MKPLFDRRSLKLAMLATAVLHFCACSVTDDGDEGDDSGSRSKRKPAACVPAEERPACLAHEFAIRGLEPWVNATVEDIDQAEFEVGSDEREAVDSCQACDP